MSNWFRALWILPVLALAACGGGGGGGGSAPAPNRAPTANFAFTCTDLACTLTSTSTDENVGDAIGSYAWTFGDGSTAATANPTHTFTAAGTYNVGLTVSDTAGLTNSVTRQITVTAPASGPGPHANFTKTCTSLDCTFTDTSTYDAGSTPASRVWDFGDTATASTSPTTHTYAATTLTTFTTKLTVTDAGGKSSTSTQSVVVSPPATSLNCVGGGCALTLSTAARVTATIVSNSCSATGNEVALTAPVQQILFPDGCTATTNVPVADQRRRRVRRRHDAAVRGALGLLRERSAGVPAVGPRERQLPAMDADVRRRLRRRRRAGLQRPRHPDHRDPVNGMRLRGFAPTA